MSLLSISYEKAADLVMYGRTLLQETAKNGFTDVVEACRDSHKKFKSQLKYTTIPAYNLWAELKAQREAVVNFKPLEKIDSTVGKTVELLKNYYEGAGLVTAKGECPELTVDWPQTRSVKQFVVDVLCPKKRSEASRFTRSQDYVYSA